MSSIYSWYTSIWHYLQQYWIVRHTQDQEDADQGGVEHGDDSGGGPELLHQCGQQQPEGPNQSLHTETAVETSRQNHPGVASVAANRRDVIAVIVRLVDIGRFRILGIPEHSSICNAGFACHFDLLRENSYNVTYSLEEMEVLPRKLSDTLGITRRFTQFNSFKDH